MDICIRGARLLDPTQGLDWNADVGISAGKIVEIAEHIPVVAKQEVDGHSCLLIPGMVDIHTHVGGSELAALSLPADEAGLLRGVTLVGDAGTAGAHNVEHLLALLSQAQTSVAIFLNAHPWGISSLPQDWSRGLELSLMKNVLEHHQERIRGIKVLASGAFATHVGLDGLKKIKEFAGQHDLPLMIHLGTEPDETLPGNWEHFCAELPAILDAGDILCHCYTAKQGGLITPDRRFYPQLRDAVRRGVALDAAVALRHFDFICARQGLDDGFIPQTISTDLTRNNVERGVFDLPTTMSRFLALGMPLLEVISCVTHNPCLLLKKKIIKIQKGSLAILSLLKEHFTPCIYGYGDKSIQGTYLLSPKGVILKNEYLPCCEIGKIKIYQF